MLKSTVICCFFTFTGFLSAAVAQNTVPLPQPRPSLDAPLLPAPQVPAQKPHENTVVDDGADFKSCLAALNSRGVEFVVEQPEPSENDRCVVPNPVRLLGIASGEGTIRLPSKPLLNCGFALRLSIWLSDVSAPVISSFAKSPLLSVVSGPGYQCRNRNRKKSGKISEHAFGNAIDITGFKLASRETIRISAIPDGPEQQVRMLMALRLSACGFFTTVLGPGSNEAHRAHFHLDYGKHGRTWNYRICE